MPTLADDDISITPEPGHVWSIRFTTTPDIAGWVIETGNYFTPIHADHGTLSKQMTLSRAANLIACS